MQRFTPLPREPRHGWTFVDFEDRFGRTLEIDAPDNDFRSKWSSALKIFRNYGESLSVDVFGGYDNHRHGCCCALVGTASWSQS